MTRSALSKRRAVLVGVCAAVAVAVIAIALESGRSDKETTATVDVASPGHGRSIAPAGISFEYDSIEAYAGPPGRRNEQFARLLRRLSTASGAPLRIRVGGNSTDQSWWNPSRQPRPATVLFDITPDTLDSLAWLVARTNARVTLGVNLALNDPRRAVDFARAAQRRLPAGSLEALEIGNEPDLYASERTFRVGRLTLRRLRKRAHYDPAAYERELHPYLVALSKRPKAAPSLLIGGFAGSSWLPSLPGLLERERGLAGGVSTHLYALRDCEDKTPPESLVDRLVDPQTTRRMVDRVEPVLADARRHGLAVQITELNSAVCGGVPRVSDTFAAALWLQGALASLADAGVAGADVHTFPGAYYAPIALRPSEHGTVAAPRPAYGGMLLFARSAPRGSRTTPVSLDDAPRDLRAWATIGGDGRARVTLADVGEGEDRTVGVLGSAPLHGCATATRLQAPALGSRDGVRLANEGLLCPDVNGKYRVRVPSPGAVLLTLPRR